MTHTQRQPAPQGWVEPTLRFLAYPANLAFAGLAAFVLALPLITALPAAIAAARSIDGWLHDGDTTVFTSTFREFGATWRRTLPLGILTVVILAMLTFDGAFLWAQMATGTRGPALALGAASIPVAVSVGLMLLALPVAASRNRDGTVRHWLLEAGYLVTTRPLQATVLLALSSAVTITLVLVPTIIPFFGISVPVYLALVSLGAPSTPRQAA